MPGPARRGSRMHAQPVPRWRDRSVARLDAVLPFSTGVIMEPLPLDKIVSALPACRRSAGRARMARRGARDHDDGHGAEGSFRTGARRWRADHRHRHRQGFRHDRSEHGYAACFRGYRRAVGRSIARGAHGRCRAGIVQPHHDRRRHVDQRQLRRDELAIERRWRRCGSANDPRLPAIAEAILAAATRLAQAIVRDGEGATKLIRITVEGGRDEAECDRVARTIAQSPLVKTAFFASDPNLGSNRVRDRQRRHLRPRPRSGLVLARRSAGRRRRGRAASYREADGQRVMAEPEITVRVALGRGRAEATVWTCDLSHEYVRINADYRS